MKTALLPGAALMDFGEVGFVQNKTATAKQNFNQPTRFRKQAGDSNTIQGSEGVAGSFALQRGMTNTLTITQASGLSVLYVANVANVSQLGNGNTITITHTGVTPYTIESAALKGLVA